ncbi:MAG TPA: beta-ketoacyl synthase N-terminal-like domain-containing protein, partial [Chthoniobacterales bacterium]|nr:beta-ketoacyl synthase N-terminal-like domain-containing protein [Chthoniobacterales bacterium]
MPELSSPSHCQKRVRVAVVGAGIVSPLGVGLGETLTALREGKDCVTPVTAFPVDRCRCQTAGQIADERLAAANEHHRHPERLHRVAQMMILALKEALAQAPGFQPELTVVGTTSGGMTFGEQYYRGLKTNGRSSRHAPTLIANYTPQKPV